MRVEVYIPQIDFHHIIVVLFLRIVISNGKNSIVWNLHFIRGSDLTAAFFFGDGGFSIFREVIETLRVLCLLLLSRVYMLLYGVQF